jgi:hypothetical protein
MVKREEKILLPLNEDECKILLLALEESTSDELKNEKTTKLHTKILIPWFDLKKLNNENAKKRIRGENSTQIIIDDIVEKDLKPIVELRTNVYLKDDGLRSILDHEELEFRREGSDQWNSVFKRLA